MSTHNLCFRAKLTKICLVVHVHPYKPQFYESWVQGVGSQLHKHVSKMI